MSAHQTLAQHATACMRHRRVSEHNAHKGLHGTIGRGKQWNCGSKEVTAGEEEWAAAVEEINTALRW